MKNSKTLFKEVTASISLSENEEEIQSMVYILMAKLWNLSRTEIIAEKLISCSDQSILRLSEMIQRINKHEPVQYVLGEEFFFGRRFLVNSSVLIPRPETEELIHIIVLYNKTKSQNHKGTAVKILDIGTGSGCIAITLFHEVKNAVIYGTDISKGALKVAAHNAENLQAQINWMEHNILTAEIPFDNLDVVVSNPPYVTQKETSKMAQNVLQYEPHLALFVSDEDPLIFHRLIVHKSKRTLKTNGLLALEINERFGNDVARLFLQAGFHDVKTMKDMVGKERVVCGFNQ